VLAGRELIQDALGGKFDDVFLKWDAPSQTDLFGKLAMLMFPELVRPVSHRATANVKPNELSYRWNFGGSHVAWPHQHVQDNQASSVPKNSPAYFEACRLQARRALCLRKKYFPNLNELNTELIFPDILPLNQRDACDFDREADLIAATNADYVYDPNFIAQNQTATYEYLTAVQANRQLCTDPYYEQMTLLRRTLFPHIGRGDIRTDYYPE